MNCDQDQFHLKKDGIEIITTLLKDDIPLIWSHTLVLFLFVNVFENVLFIMKMFFSAISTMTAHSLAAKFGFLLLLFLEAEAASTFSAAVVCCCEVQQRKARKPEAPGLQWQLEATSVQNAAHASYTQ